MKALVTGGAGFIGSRICEALCRRGAKVVVLDNLSTGKLHNLDWKTPGDEIEFVQGEVADEALVKKLVAGCDWVFHEAAQPSVPLSVAQPMQTNRDNLDALLVASRDAGVKRFMFASSSAVYGDSEAPLKHESHGVCPISPYSGVIAKFCTLLLQGTAPKIFGDGLQTRDYVYVQNVVSANLLAADFSAARAGLNYVPEVTWQKGLEHTLDFYRAGNK